jgi:hypothetical protein
MIKNNLCIVLRRLAWAHFQVQSPRSGRLVRQIRTNFGSYEIEHIIPSIFPPPLHSFFSSQCVSLFCQATTSAVSFLARMFCLFPISFENAITYIWRYSSKRAPQRVDLHVHRLSMFLESQRISILAKTSARKSLSSFSESEFFMAEEFSCVLFRSEPPTQTMLMQKGESHLYWEGWR